MCHHFGRKQFESELRYKNDDRIYRRCWSYLKSIEKRNTKFWEALRHHHVNSVAFDVFLYTITTPTLLLYTLHAPQHFMCWFFILLLMLSQKVNVPWKIVDNFLAITGCTSCTVVDVVLFIIICVFFLHFARIFIAI